LPTLAAVFNGIGAHELGHASHYAIVGEGYWVGYRDHIVFNSGYGNFPGFIGNQVGRVALGEAIGNYTGNLYGGTNAGGENLEFENGFIPRGLMFDLVDTNDDRVTDPNTGESVIENIEGFTPFMIFNALDNSTNDIRTYRDRLNALHLSDTPNTEEDFNNVIDVYDVFN